MKSKLVLLKKAKRSTLKSKTGKKRKCVLPSAYVKDNLVTSSLQILEELHKKAKKNTLFGDETSVFIELRCIKIPNYRGSLRFVFPHSTVASTGEVCLITPDLKKGRKPDHEPTTDYWGDLLRKFNISNVKTVLPMRQLRVEYDQFELKRRLLTQHDFIMVDTRVLNHVSHVLGKMFFKKHNMLIPVRLNEKHDLKKDIDVGLRTAMLRLNDGPTSTIIVGHTGMSQEHLKENILSLVQQIRDKYPGGETNIRSISVKLPLSLSLPLYLTLRPANISIPKHVRKKPKHFTVVEDDLSTMLYRRVKVAPDGSVQVKRELPDNDSDMAGETNVDESNAEESNNESE